MLINHELAQPQLLKTNHTLNFQALPERPTQAD